MALALYRKYRPQTFGDVVGHDHIVALLRYSIDHDQLGHGYLLHGPRGVGKTTIARLIARGANCLEPKNGEPCGKCAACVAFASNTFMDLIEIDAASHRGIDAIRELTEKVQVAPAMGKKKVIIIDEVHMLTKEAFNALLKTLEEPPAHVVFVLATTEIEKVPETILSRVARFDLGLLTSEQLVATLKGIAKAEKVKIDDDALALVAQAGQGSARDAISLFNKVIRQASKGKLGVEEIERVLGLVPVAVVQEMTGYLLARDRSGALGFLSATLERGVAVRQLLLGMIDYTRQLLLAKSGVEASARLVIVEDAKPTFAAHQKTANPKMLLLLMRRLLDAAEDLRVVPQPAMALELAIVDWCTDEAANMPGVPAETATSPMQVSAPVTAPVQSVVSTPAPKPLVKKTPEPKIVVVPEQIVSQTPPQQPIPKPKNVEKTTPVVPLADITKNWATLVDTMTKKNYAMGVLLKASKPNEVSGRTVTVCCQFAFHKERLELDTNKKMVEDALTELVGTQVLVVAVVDAAALERKADVEPMGAAGAPNDTQGNELLALAQEVFQAPAATS